MPKNWRTYLVLLWVLAISVGVVSARGLLQGEECHIQPEETVRGTLFVLCRTLTIEGRVMGNLIGGVIEARISGYVSGNLYLIGGQVDLTGRVGGDLHYAGLVLNIAPPSDSEAESANANVNRGVVGGDLFNLSLTTRLATDTRLYGSIIAIGYQLILDGEVKGEVNFWGSALRIGGRISGDIYATVGDPQADSSQLETLLLPLPFDVSLVNPGLVVRPDAVVIGLLQYTGPAQGQIDGELYQPPDYTPIIVNPTLPIDEPGALSLYSQQILQEFWPLLLVGVFILALSPNLIYAPSPNLRLRPVSTFSVGMLTFILSFPVILISSLLGLLVLLALAILRLDALLGAALVLVVVLNAGGAALFYFASIFIARAIVCLALGRWIIGTFASARRPLHNSYVYYGVGVFILAIIAALPIIGWVANALSLFLGLGAILIFLLEYGGRLRWASPRYQYSSADPSPYARARSQLLDTPYTVDDAPLGMQNLPEGFDFSFFEDDE